MRIHYPIPLHLQKVYRDLSYRRGDFPVAEGLSKRIVSLPLYPSIKSKQIEYVVSAIKRALDL